MFFANTSIESLDVYKLYVEIRYLDLKPDKHSINVFQRDVKNEYQTLKKTKELPDHKTLLSNLQRVQTCVSDCLNLVVLKFS